MSTKIEWADESWNPIAAFDRETGKRGWFCTKVSPGCANCYAEKVNKFRGNGHLYRVPNLDKVRFELAPTLTHPLHWRKRRRVFVNSMTDLFLEAHTDEMIDQVIGVIAALRAWAMPHEFLVLTKRPERQRDYFSDPQTRERIAKIAAHHSDDDNADNVWNGLMHEWWPLSNLWLGVSVENQAAADERIPLLLDTPSAIRFLSCEPLLGKVCLRQSWRDYLEGWNVREQHHPHCHPPDDCDSDCPVAEQYQTEKIDWVIIGGESGSDARSCSVDWIQDLMAQCKSTGTPVFVKQMGKWITGDDAGFVINRWLLDNGRVFVPPILGSRAGIRPQNAIAFGNCNDHGGDWAEWPAHLRVREFPAVAGV